MPSIHAKSGLLVALTAALVHQGGCTPSPQAAMDTDPDSGPKTVTEFSNDRVPPLGTESLEPGPIASFASMDDGILDAAYSGAIFYLNRWGGTYTPGRDDSRSNTAFLAKQTTSIAPWRVSDQGWAEVMSCVREIWAPYDVVITDVDPGNVPHFEAVVAGRPQDLGRPDNSLGSAAIAEDCSVLPNGVTFTFAEAFHSGDYRGVCETIAQEIAHNFGLDHQLDCRDPMTYLPDCGKKSFQNKAVQCGEDTARECYCGGATQNTAKTLRDTIGPRSATCSVSISPEQGTATTAFSATWESNSNSCRWSLDGVDQGEIACNGSIDNAKFAEGTHTVTLVVTNPDGSKRSCDSNPVTIGAPADAPTCSVSIGPDSGTTSTNFDVAWESEDATSCRWALDGVEQGAIACSGRIRRQFSEGEHTLSLLATGPGGTTPCPSNAVTVTREANSPTCSISLSPGLGTVETKFDIVWESDAKQCRWQLDGVDQEGTIPCSGAASRSFEVGMHRLTLVPIGSDGTPAPCDSNPVDVRAGDVPEPIVTITAPADRAVVSPGFTVAVDAQGEPKIESVAVYLDEELVGTKSEAPFTFTTSSDIGDGEYVVRAIAGDGTTEVTREITVQVVSDPPGGNPLPDNDDPTEEEDSDVKSGEVENGGCSATSSSAPSLWFLLLVGAWCFMVWRRKASLRAELSSGALVLLLCVTIGG